MTPPDTLGRASLSSIGTVFLALALAGCGGNGGWGVSSAAVDNPPSGGPLAFGPAVALSVDGGTQPIGRSVAASIGIDGVMRVAWSQPGLPLEAGGSRRTVDVGWRSHAPSSPASTSPSTSASTPTWSSPTLAGTALTADRADDEIVGLTTARGAALANPAASWLWYRQPLDARQSGRLSALQIGARTSVRDDLPPLPAAARASGLVMASNARGTLAAAWTERVNGQNRVHVTVRTDASAAWSARVAMQPDASIDSSEPALAIDPDGRVLVLWREGAAGAGAVRSRLLDAGLWQPVSALPLSTTDAGAPAVVATGSASFVAAWMQTLPGEAARSLRAARWTPTAWAMATDPIEALPEAPDELVLAATPGGGALALWRQADELWFQRFSAARQTWSATPTPIPETRRNASRAPRLAVSDSGRAVAVWTRPDLVGTSDVVYAVLEANGDSFSTPASVRFGSLAASAPSVAAAGNHALVAWQQVIANQTHPDVMARVYTPR
jgi:hypothetical protein